MSPGLSPDQIKALLAMPEKKRGKKKEIDTSIRDHKTWFALAPKFRDVEEGVDLKCDNPNCVDPRPTITTAMGNEIRTQYIINVHGQNMCRYCFLDGWLLNDPDQTEL